MLAIEWVDVGLIAFCVLVVNFVVAILIGRRLGKISDILDSRNALVVPDELGPDDRIVIWHKDDPIPPELEPEPDPPPPRKPIVGLE